MKDQFESRVEDWLGDQADPDPEDLERLRLFAATLGDRRRTAPIWLAALGLVATATVLVLAINLGWQRQPTVPDGGASYPLITSDPRYAKCGGGSAPVIAAFPMLHAADYIAHFPKMGLSPELYSGQAAFVVVYQGRYAGGLFPGLPAIGVTARPEPTLAPNHHDLCVWLGDATTGDSYIYGDVDITGMTATVPPASGLRLPVITIDPRFDKCRGDTAPVLTAFPMPHASDYTSHFPNATVIAELETDQPAFVVVFQGLSPDALTGGGDSTGSARQSLQPNHHDLCVMLGERTTTGPFLYLDVDTTGMTP
jgi:hypothetical protein